MSEDLEVIERGAQRVIDVVQAQGVPYIFGIPGAKIDAVFDALADGGPELVVCRHEQNAAFIAAAYGRMTGTPGVVLVTSGPGTSNLATGLLTANTEQDPIVALCGAVRLPDRLKRTHQSMEAPALLATVTKHVAEVVDPVNVSEAVANAFRVAATEPRGATAVVLAADVMAAPSPGPITMVATPGQLGAAPADEIERARQLIQKAARPVVLVGLRGADPASAEAVRELIAATGLPVVETFQAAGVVSRELEDHYLGRVGLFRNQPADVLVARADVLLTIGYDPVEYDPGLWNFDATRPVIHLDSLPAELDVDYQPALELRGGVAPTVRALSAALTGLELHDDFGHELAALRQALRQIDDDESTWSGEGDRVNPAALVLKIRELLDDSATIACDIGSVYIYMARHFRVYDPRHLLFSNGQQTLGVALPWAMAACLARPGTPVVSISGDGGFLFSAQELETATRLGLSFTHVIFRDDTYDMVGFQELLKYGRKSGVQLADYDVVAYAKAFGATGYRVQSEEEFAEVFARSFTEPGPTIIDVRVDYSNNVRLADVLAEDAFE